jgi:hypothetical protein
MKKLLTSMCLILFMVALAVSEPIITEETKCIEKGNCEIGLGVSYGVDTWKWTDSFTGDNSVSVMLIQLPVKYGITDKLQLNLNVPYRSWKSETEIGTVKTNSDETGIGQVDVGGKLCLAESFALGLDVQTPTGDIDKKLGEGMNIGVMLITSKNLDPLKISGNVGYLYKSKYTDENDKEWDPADPIIARLSLEYPMSSISIIGEAQGQIIGKTKSKPKNGTEADIEDSNGSIIDLLIGGQYLKDALKIKLGFAIAVGNENLRGGLFPFYDSWDWKIILSGSYKFKI